MSAIHIRNVPDKVIAAIREKARDRGVSMQKELRDILVGAASEPSPVREVEPIGLIEVDTGSEASWDREEIYGEQGR